MRDLSFRIAFPHVAVSYCKISLTNIPPEVCAALEDAYCPVHKNDWRIRHTDAPLTTATAPKAERGASVGSGPRPKSAYSADVAGTQCRTRTGTVS
ncbi:hypothetical protein FIU86_08175 [Roseovarius sp. THAF9]|nr:hypothetical protein FIU86_08175 [Roseovarius sp. THAF9]